MAIVKALGSQLLPLAEKEHDKYDKIKEQLTDMEEKMKQDVEKWTDRKLASMKKEELVQEYRWWTREMCEHMSKYDENLDDLPDNLKAMKRDMKAIDKKYGTKKLANLSRKELFFALKDLIECCDTHTVLFLYSGRLVKILDDYLSSERTLEMLGA